MAEKGRTDGRWIDRWVGWVGGIGEGWVGLQAAVLIANRHRQTRGGEADARSCALPRLTGLTLVFQPSAEVTAAAWRGRRTQRKPQVTPRVSLLPGPCTAGPCLSLSGTHEHGWLGPSSSGPWLQGLSACYLDGPVFGTTTSYIFALSP